MNHNIHTLNDLIAMARDGKDFYEHASVKVDDPQLKSLFTRIAGVKSEIVSGLSSEVLAAGDTPAASGTLAGDISQLYGELRAMAGNKDYAYVAQLEHSEDCLLKAFDEARTDKEVSPSAQAVLNRLAPEVRECHELMRTRKQALKQAA